MKNLEETIKLSVYETGTSELNVGKVKITSVIKCLFKIYGVELAVGASIKLVQDLLNFAGPFFLSLIITFINDPTQNVSNGIIYSFLLFFFSTTRSIILQQYFDRMFVIGSNIRTSLVNIIYKKVITFLFFK